MENKKLKHFFEVTLQGLFWLLPIVAIIIVALWLYEKIDLLVSGVFDLVGFAPENNQFLWFVFSCSFICCSTLFCRAFYGNKTCRVC